MTGLRARVRFLEERQDVQRLARARRNRQRQDSIREAVALEDRATMREMQRMWREDQALTNRIEATFPDLVELPGAVKTLDWFERWNWDLSDADIWPPAPVDTPEYLAADLARWEEIASCPDLTPEEDTRARWELATLRYLSAVAHAL